MFKFNINSMHKQIITEMKKNESKTQKQIYRM